MPWPLTTSADTRRLWAVVAILLLAVLTPTVCVLWFMNQAVTNERWAVRQRLQEAYKGELATRQRRIDDQWQKVDAALEGSQKETPAAAFRGLVTQGGVTSVLVYSKSGGDG